MAKILVKSPLVEMDGCEMARVMWGWIKDRLIRPYLDIELEYYDLGITNRNRTDDRVTIEAALAIKRRGVGVKCATITPDAQRIEEFHLSHAWPSPNATIRGILDGTIFRKPIMAANLIPAVRSWRKPIVIARHSYGDEYKSQELLVPGPGTVEMVYTPADGGAAVRKTVHEFADSGVVMAMHNTDRSIRSFAQACLHYALSEKIDLWFAAKDTISKTYHGRFKEIFDQEVSRRRSELDEAGIAYRYLLIDDAVAQIMKHPGGILWACRNYDGDVLSDMVASGFGSLGMMTSVLVSPDGAFEFEAAHGTVRRHYHEHLKGNPTSTNPVASIFAWTGALKTRGCMDDTPEVIAFAQRVEKTVLDVIESGVVTRDLACLTQPHAVACHTTESFIDHIAQRL